MRSEVLRKEVLTKGNKQLQVTIQEDEEHGVNAITRIENVPGLPPKPGATTELYGQGFEIIQQEADARNQPIEYYFLTMWHSMATWFNKKGRHLGDFRITAETPTFVQARRTFHPRSSNK